MGNFITDYLGVSRQIAYKTRRLISRSANRKTHAQYDKKGDIIGTMDSEYVKPKDKTWNKARQEELPVPVFKYFLAMRLMLARTRDNYLSTYVKSMILSCNKDASISITGKINDVTREREFRRLIKIYPRNNKKIYELFDDLCKCKGIQDQRIRYGKNKNLSDIESVEKAIECNIGNCGECALLAFLMYQEYTGWSKYFKYGPKKVDLYNPPWIQRVHWEGDHSFVLLHKSNPKNIDLNDYSKWLGSSAIIVCDPWYYNIGNALVASVAKGSFGKVLKGSTKNINQLQLGRVGEGHDGPQFLTPKYESDIIGRRGQFGDRTKPPTPLFKDKSAAKKRLYRFKPKKQYD